VVHRGDGVSAFCCASILHFGSKAEVDASYLMDHSVGAVLIGHIATSCSIQPQVSLAFISTQMRFFPRLSLCVVPAACGASSYSSSSQQRSKNSYKSVSPTWNQGFVFADAYPTARVLLGMFGLA
jgi:hypothetical protein